jgi:hypothetical protein
LCKISSSQTVPATNSQRGSSCWYFPVPRISPSGPTLILMASATIGEARGCAAALLMGWPRRPNYSHGGQKCCHELRGTIPRCVGSLTASPKRAPPEISDVVPKRTQTLGVGGHCVVRQIATHHLSQPSALLWSRFVNSWLTRPLDTMEYRIKREHTDPND